MTTTTKIVSRASVPEAVFDLLHHAFPDDLDDQRAFWPENSVHAVAYKGDTLVAHAGLITRTLYINGTSHNAAFVEYVAAEPRRSGYGSIAMRAMAEEIKRRGFALAALATGSFSFYERLGWVTWRGPVGYRERDGSSVSTPDEHPMVMDLGANVNLDALIECEWRPGSDIW